MAIKRVKEAFNIEHNILVEGDYICIGSGYVRDLIKISLDGSEVIPSQIGIMDNAKLKRYYDELSKASKSGKLKQLIEAPDEFAELHKVYTVNEGSVVLKYCEAYGYPNTTTDGEMMYENNFFKTEAEARKYLIKDIRLGVKYGWRTLKEKTEDFFKYLKYFMTEIFYLVKAYVWRKVIDKSI